MLISMLRKFIIYNKIRSLIMNDGKRKKIFEKLQPYLYEMIVEKDSRALLTEVKIDKYNLVNALLTGVGRVLDKGFFSKRVASNMLKCFLKGLFLEAAERKEEKRYYKRHGYNPPAFITISPTGRCNLDCIGCYAGSSSNDTKLPKEVFERVVDEAHNILGNRFLVISGGEPFLYNDGNKDLLDIVGKYRDMFILIYTNGTLIDDSLAHRMAKLSNITPAISVEGFEKETDERRGKGVFKKILKAMEILRKHGVPFGISVTSTKKNYQTLLSDEFYDFFFQEQGAIYMWQFQLMPIGKAADAFELVLTPEQRFQLFLKWKYLIREKKYFVADFWNSGTCSEGCIAYGREGGYFYINWDGKVTPCVFIPYYVDDIKEIYANGGNLEDVLMSEFFKRGREWQTNYGYGHLNVTNWLMPCSIRDHYENFRKNILTPDAKPLDDTAKKALEDPEYYKFLKKFDEELSKITSTVWEKEYKNEKS